MAGRPSQYVTLRGKCWAARTAAEAIITSSTSAMGMPARFAFFVHPPLGMSVKAGAACVAVGALDTESMVNVLFVVVKTGGVILCL